MSSQFFWRIPQFHIFAEDLAIIHGHGQSLGGDSALQKNFYSELNKQEGNENINPSDTKLLFRASEHEYNCKVFQKLCGDQGATMTIYIIIEAMCVSTQKIGHQHAQIAVKPKNKSTQYYK